MYSSMDKQTSSSNNLKMTTSATAGESLIAQTQSNWDSGNAFFPFVHMIS